jgi:hypothetical protein
MNLPEYNLKAEFWVNEVNANDAYNDTASGTTSPPTRCASAAPTAPLPLVEIPRWCFRK